MAQKITVHELLTKPFSSRSEMEKREIVRGGKPRPLIRDQVVVYNGKQISIMELYEEETWLTYCEKLQSVFCWTCLLFPIVIPVAEYKSFIAKITDSTLYNDITLHKKSVYHIRGFFRFTMYTKEGVLTINKPSNVNSKCYNNHSHLVLKQIINVVCFLVSQASPPCGSTKDYGNILTSDHCIQTLMLLNNYDVSSLTNDAISFVRRFPKVLADIVDSLAYTVKQAIRREIMSCSHVSLILSEHSEVEKKSKLSTVLRYVYKGSISEKFVEFTNLLNGKDINIIQNHILRIASEYEVSGYDTSKLFSISCDGAVLQLRNLSILIASFQRREPSVLFAPCHFHDFSHVLEQRLSEFPECELFFKKIESMRCFFEDNPELCDTLFTISDGKIPNLQNLKLNNSQFLRLLKMHKGDFAALFWNLAEDSEDMKGEIVAKAMGFHCMLEEYNTVLMLEAFHLLFGHVAVLTEILGSSSPENVLNGTILETIKSDLTKQKMDGFEKLWKNTVQEILTDCNLKSFQAEDEKETTRLLELFLKVVDCIVSELKVRFKSVGKLEFLSLLNCEANNTLVISNYQNKKVCELQDPLIDNAQLLTELKVLCKNGSLFSGKSIYELMDIFINAELQDTFKNTYELAESILAMPCKPVSPGNEGPSKLDVIRTWSSVSDKPEMMSLCQLLIEKDYLEYLQSRMEFHDDVIAKLREINNEVQAMFVGAGSVNAAVTT